MEEEIKKLMADHDLNREKAERVKGIMEEYDLGADDALEIEETN